MLAVVTFSVNLVTVKVAAARLSAVATLIVHVLTIAVTVATLSVHVLTIAVAVATLSVHVLTIAVAVATVSVNNIFVEAIVRNNSAKFQLYPPNSF